MQKLTEGGVSMNCPTVMPQDEWYVTIKKYCQLSGLSYATVKHLIKSGQLKYITTEKGLQRIDIRESGNDQAVIERLNNQEKMLTALCRQFNTPVDMAQFGAAIADSKSVLQMKSLQSVNANQ